MAFTRQSELLIIFHQPYRNRVAIFVKILKAHREIVQSIEPEEPGTSHIMQSHPFRRRIVVITRTDIDKAQHPVLTDIETVNRYKHPVTAILPYRPEDIPFGIFQHKARSAVCVNPEISVSIFSVTAYGAVRIRLHVHHIAPLLHTGDHLPRDGKKHISASGVFS